MPILIRVALCFAALCVLICAVPAQSLDQDAKEAQKPASSISGRVTINGKAAPGVTVAARKAYVNNRGLLAQTKTDEDGRYRLEVPEADTYLVTTYSFAFAPPIENSIGDPGKAVTITSGEAVEGVDLALVPGGVISGRVTDANGRPIIGLNVYALRLDDHTPMHGDEISKLPTPGYAGLLALSTDDRGIYRICGLPAGRYVVGVMRGKSLASRAMIYYPGVSSHQKAKPVEVTSGHETANVDIQFGSLAKTFSASGQIIVAETGQPVKSQISYACEPEIIAPNGQSIGYRSSDTYTNVGDQGRFRIESLSPGRYRLGLLTNQTDESLYAKPLYFEVTDHDLTGLELKCYRGATISGLIAIEGEIPEEAVFYPRPEALVIMPGGESHRTLVSDLFPDLLFAIKAVPPGRATIQSGRPAWGGFSLLRIEHNGAEIRNLVEVGPGGQLTGGIEIKPGEDITGVRVVLAYGAGTMRGQVKIEGGALPEGLRLSVQCRRPGSQSGFLKQANVDALGRFEFQNLSPGDYEVQLEAPNLTASDPITARQLQATKQIISVRNGETATVTLTLNLSARGKESSP